MQTTPRPPKQDRDSNERFDRAGWLILAGLTALAAVMRFYRLETIPAGLHYDEAYNGLDALGLHSLSFPDWPIFFHGNYGREPLFVWLMSAALQLFGQSVWAARSVSAISGVLMVPALAGLGWQVAPRLGVRRRQMFALWCAATVLALLWSQIFARHAIRASLFVLLETLLWAAMWRAWQQRPPALAAWLATGLLAGLTFYTYLPARLLPVILLPLLAAAFRQERQRLRKHLPGLVAGAAGALLAAAPLAFFFLQHPVAFSTRIGQAAIGIGSREVLSNLAAALGMFLFAGDQNPIVNVPSRPALDIPMGLLFLVGAAYAFRRARSLGSIYLLAGLATFLLPTIFSDYAPNFQRAIGSMPFVCLLAALGAERIYQFIGARAGDSVSRAAPLLIWALFALSIAFTNRAYFDVWRSNPSLFHYRTEGYTLLAGRMAGQDETRVYVSPRDPTHPYAGAEPHASGVYLLQAKGVSSQYHDERYCIRLAPSVPARYFSLTTGEGPERLRPDAFFPDSAAPQEVVFDAEGGPWATEIRAGAAGSVVLPDVRSHEVGLADGVSLLGYSLSSAEVEPGQKLNVRLIWQVSDAPSKSYTLFFHLLHKDEEGAVSRLAVYDRPTGEGSCPTNEWLPEEIVVEVVRTVLPSELPPGDLFFSLGLYSPSDGGRLPVEGSGDGSILIGPLKRGGS